jgi:hypothetical protein
MGDFHEVMPALHHLPMGGKGMLKMIAVPLFDEVFGLNGPPVAPDPVTPGNMLSSVSGMADIHAQ